MCPTRDCRAFSSALGSHHLRGERLPLCGRDTDDDAFSSDFFADLCHDLWECPDRRCGLQRSLPAEVQSWLGKGGILQLRRMRQCMVEKKTRRAKRVGNTRTACASVATPGAALGLEVLTTVFSGILVPNIPRLADHAAGRFGVSGQAHGR